MGHRVVHGAAAYPRVYSVKLQFREPTLSHTLMWRPVPGSFALPGVWGAVPLLQRARMRCGFPIVFILTLLSTSYIVDAMPAHRPRMNARTVNRPRGAGTWSQIFAVLLLLLLSTSLAGAMPRPKRNASA